MPLVCYHHLYIDLISMFIKVFYLSKNSLILIQQSTFRYKNLSITFSSVFLYFKGRSDLNEFERPKRGKFYLQKFEKLDASQFNLKKVESNVVYRFQHI